MGVREEPETVREKIEGAIPLKQPLSRVLAEHWWKIIVAGVIAGFLTEFMNTYIFHWWIYHKPWTVFFLPEIPVGAPLIAGWVFMAVVVLLLTIVFENIRPRTRWQLYWVLSWIILGFAGEFFNSNVWRTWHYDPTTIWSQLVVPFLNFSIFVPIVGWGATGIITFWFHKYFLAAFGKGPYRCPVCWMKVGKKIPLKHGRKKYYFCSSNCKDEFKQNPKHYTKKR